METKIIKLQSKINTSGYYEQEKAYLFSALYNNRHKLNKNTIGMYKQFENELKRGKYNR